MTNELGNDPDRYIEEFVSTGPKSYAYRDNYGHSTCKFKGVSKTLHNLNVVNFKSMLLCIEKGLVVDLDDVRRRVDPEYKVVGAENLVFKLDRFGRIKTDYQAKVFRMVYDKRWISDEYRTYPWGCFRDTH